MSHTMISFSLMPSQIVMYFNAYFQTEGETVTNFHKDANRYIIFL